jgi:monoamine oxidase
VTVSGTTDALIVGAGIAGLAAARALISAGLSVRILEARDRIGGRIYTLRDPNFPSPVELGAEFVHGKQTDFWRLIKQSGVRTRKVSGKMLRFEQGELHAAGEADLDIDDSGPDKPFGDTPGALDPWARAYVEGFNAAHGERVGIHGLARQQRASRAIREDRTWRIPDGYDRLLRPLICGDLQLSTAVRHIRWTRGKVQAAGFTAARAIITVPLPLIAHIQFDPPIQHILDAASALAMGDVVRVTFRFREPFWDSGVSFVFSLDDYFPTWWTPARGQPLLVGWSAAHSAERLLAGGEEFIVQRAMAALSRFFHIDAAQLLDAWRWHDWRSDPFAQGAYSYIPAGAMSAPTILSGAVDDTLFFAGEHTDSEGFTGTVHGALFSGLRAAKQITG